MAGCYARNFNIFKILLFFTSFLQSSAISSDIKPIFRDFPVHVFQRHIKESRHQPFCVLFRKPDAGSTLEKWLYDLWRKDDSHANYTRWEFGSFSAQKEGMPANQKKPSKVPTVRCYLGETSPYDLDEDVSKKKLRKWLLSLDEKHQEHNKDVTNDVIDQALRDYRCVVIGFPNSMTILKVEDMIYQLAQKYDDTKVLIAHPHAPNIIELRERFKVYKSPAVVVLHVHSEETGPENETSDVVHTELFPPVLVDHKVLDTHLTARSIPAVCLNMTNMATNVPSEDMWYDRTPTIAGFYSYWTPGTQEYLSAFKRTVLEFRDLQVDFRFGLVNLWTDDGKLVFHKWVEYMPGRVDPFTVVYFKDVYGHVKQETLKGIPTPLTVFEWLNRTGVSVMNTNGRFLQYHPWGMTDPTQFSMLFEGPYGSRCSPWSNNNTDNSPRPYLSRKQLEKMNKKTKKKKSKLWHEQFGTEAVEKKLTKISGIPTIGGATWSEVIEKSHAPRHAFYKSGKWAGEVTKVAMVIFIMADCRSCNRSMDTFRNLSVSVRYIDGGSLYLVNCTAEPELCAEHKIRGYPTVTAFRGLGWLEAKGCLSQQSQKKYKNYVRLDYHGVLLERPMMDWFSSIATNAVEDRKFDVPGRIFVDKDVRLVATLMPRSSHYLPLPRRREGQYFYTYDCFRLVCERLYSLVKCYSVYSSQIPAREFADEDVEVVITKLRLERKDGVSATVIELGKTLWATLEDHDDIGLYKFHRPHRYNVKSSLKCEDDHSLCTDLITDFTLDHSRLPVTPITSAFFHTTDSFIFEDSLPILIALVHSENVTELSSFFQNLTQVAQKFYNEITVMSLDVEAYASWAGSFVPLNYRRDMLDQTKGPGFNDKLKMYVYPRLCMVDKSDHTHAAFHPPLRSRDYRKKYLTVDRMMQFVTEYLQDPSKMKIETEQF